MSGIYHDYYTVALAPGIAGTVAVAGGVLWARRELLLARCGLAIASCATGVWSVRLLMRAGGSWTTLGGFVAVACTMAALGLLFADRLPDAVARTSLVLAVVAALAGPAGYSVNTAQTAHTGSIVTAGPVAGMGGPGGARGGMRGGTPTGTAPGGTAPGGAAPGGTAPGGTMAGGAPAAPTGTARPGGMGGGMSAIQGATVTDAMRTLLTTDASGYTWVAATVGAQGAASYQLATESPVMAVGGFNGTDPSPTLAQFKELVAAGKIHFFIGTGTNEVATWVAANFTATTVDGTTVYDLTKS